MINAEMMGATEGSKCIKDECYAFCIKQGYGYGNCLNLLDICQCGQ